LPSILAYQNAQNAKLKLENFLRNAVLERLQRSFSDADPSPLWKPSGYPFALPCRLRPPCFRSEDSPKSARARTVGWGGLDVLGHLLVTWLVPDTTNLQAPCFQQLLVLGHAQFSPVDDARPLGPRSKHAVCSVL